MCGNWGLLCLAAFADQQRSKGEPLPGGLERLIRQLVGVIEMRGAQAGGFNVLLPGLDQFSSASLRCRVLKPKRGDLCDTLFAKFHKAVRFQTWGGAIRKCFGSGGGSPMMVQGHSRFGTSSAPAVQETHPHQWSPTTRITHWVFDGEKKRWKGIQANHSVVITHNGDFDAWRPFRETTVGLGALTLWLDRVLGHRNMANGDSPKAAGVMELLICKGVWLHSVRNAWHLNVACHVEQSSGWEPLSESAPRTVPDKKAFAVWADVFEKAFAAFVHEEAEKLSTGTAHPFAPECGMLGTFLEQIEVKLKQGTSGKLLERWVPESSIFPFILAAAEAFRDNDILFATKSFFRRAMGTFGLSVTCTLQPDTIVLAAYGQPMSVGFGGAEQGDWPALATWSSEPAALTMAAKQAQKLNMAVRARLDLDDQHGELLQLRVRNVPPSTCDGKQVKTACQHADGDFFPICLAGGGVTMEALPAYHIEAYGSGFGAASSEDDHGPTVLTTASFLERLKWLEVQTAAKVDDNCVSSLRRVQSVNVKDVVFQDLNDTPAKVAEIDLNWSDEASLNCICAAGFAKQLLQATKTSANEAPEPGKARHIDLILIAVESSLWLGQQFCADLTRLFPSINAVAMSSNVALGLLQHGPGHVNPANFVFSHKSFNVSARTIGLVVSHSGTTYPTVWATRHLCTRTPYVFAMSGSFDTLMSNSIRQLTKAKVMPPRFFSTHAGVRVAEAATLTTVAMHHTFSYLLLKCIAAATEVTLPTLQMFPREQIVDGSAANDENRQGDASDKQYAFLCTACPADVEDMQRLVLTFFWGVSTLIGVDTRGNPLPKEELATSQELRYIGHRWSHHITEGYWATFVPAAYVFITVVSGYLPATTIMTAIFTALKVDEVAEWPAELVWYAIRFLDACLYVWMPMFVAMAHRIVTKRRLYMRFTTKTCAIVESTVNYKLLRAYLSKLLALSYRFATLGVIGQNGTDHFVHEYTHKAQSDVLCAVGLPDGRLPSSSSGESCTMMSLQQAKFIKRSGKGIEAVSLGHNRWESKGVFVRGLKLPTHRPVFASEFKLLPEQLGADTANGGVQPGLHGLPPTMLGQRWGDLIREGMDPFGMKRLNFGYEDLRKRMGAKNRLNETVCADILSELLRQQLGDAGEAALLGLHQFLYRWFEDSEAIQNKEYEPPQANKPPKNRAESKTSVGSKNSKDSKLKKERTTSKTNQEGGGANVMDLLAQDFDHADKHDDTVAGGDGAAKEIADVRKNIVNRLSEGGDHGHGSPGHGHADTHGADIDASLKKAISAHDTAATKVQEMEPHEFMALLHGDELQNWFRVSKQRWSKIRKIRGLMSVCAVEERPKGKQLASIVFASGMDLSGLLNGWRTTAKKQRAMNNKVVRTISAAVNTRGGSENHAGGMKVGQHLMEKDLTEAQLIQAMAITEQFHESRVGSAERLVGWFVLFHSMCKPCSNLPFLSFDLGKSESRLRVASTPAPVPNHEPPEECDFEEETGVSFNLEAGEFQI